jgi:hypothetical protein
MLLKAPLILPPYRPLRKIVDKVPLKPWHVLPLNLIFNFLQQASVNLLSDLYYPARSAPLLIHQTPNIVAQEPAGDRVARPVRFALTLPVVLMDTPCQDVLRKFNGMMH